MTDYIKQVAEAVRDACDDIAVCYRTRIDIQAQIIKLELDPIISSAPKPEPVAWFAFADNNGPVPLELYGWDEKACKYAVLKHAHSEGWKGALEGYLMHVRWGINPLYTYPPDARAEIEKANEARREAQRQLQEAIEARNRAAIEIRSEMRDELERLNAKASKREAFIEELVAQRHSELMLAATNIYDQGWYDGNHGISRTDLCAGIVSNIEQERGE